MIKPEILKSWGPGGWSYFQPETDWHAPGPLENNFDQQVKNIVAMRKANPRFNLPTDEPTVAADLEAYTEARWAKTYSKAGMAKFRIETKEDKKKESSSMPRSRSLFNAAAGLVGINAKPLEDWLGSGGNPVAPELAEHRASVCVPCPVNKAGWRDFLTLPAALAIKEYLSIKHKMKLTTTHDAQLESCNACHCVLELKVHQPIDHVKANTTAEEFEKHREANPNCWVLAEL